MLQVDADGHDGSVEQAEGQQNANQEKTANPKPPDDYGSAEDTINTNPPTPPVPQAFTDQLVGVGDLSLTAGTNILTNESRDITPGNSSSDQLNKGKEAIANALYNGESNPPRPDSAPSSYPTGVDQRQYKQNESIVRDVFTSRAAGGQDPIQGRTFFGNSFSATPPPRVEHSRWGTFQYNVHQAFGPFTHKQHPTVWIVIYDNPVRTGN